MRFRYACLAGFVLFGIDASWAAPAQLYSKTITIGWTAQTTMRDPAGKQTQSSANILYVIYVSTAGRLFERASRSAGGRTQQGDSAPGTANTKMGEARGLRFEGNNLVINRGYAGGGGSGAMRAVVTFDPSYAGCSVSVSHGKENGAVIKRQGVDGVVRELMSITVPRTSCSIQNGNAFATD